MIFRILALFVVALAINALLRRLFRQLGSRHRPEEGAPRRRSRRFSGKAEPAEFEILDDEAP